MKAVWARGVRMCAGADGIAFLNKASAVSHLEDRRARYCGGCVQFAIIVVIFVLCQLQTYILRTLVLSPPSFPSSYSPPPPAHFFSTSLFPLSVFFWCNPDLIRVSCLRGGGRLLTGARADYQRWPHWIKQCFLPHPCRTCILGIPDLPWTGASSGKERRSNKHMASVCLPISPVVISIPQSQSWQSDFWSPWMNTRG